MNKKELESLPRIPLTKELKKKAWSKGKKKNYRGDVNKFKYKYLMNSRFYRGILKINLYRCEDVRKERYMCPAYEIFLNVEGEQYITLERLSEAGERSHRWRTAKIENLDAWYWWKEADDFSAANRGTVENIRLYLKQEKRNSIVWEVSNWQAGCKKRIEERKILRNTEKWDKEMEKIPRIPNDFMRWMRRNAFDGENNMYYPFDDKGFCTACQRMVPLVKNPKHLKKARCPVCKKKVELIQKNRRKKPLWTSSYNWICCVQRYEDGIVVRNFTVRRVTTQDVNTRIPKMDYIVMEQNRVLIHGQDYAVYDWLDYKRRGERWVEDNQKHIGNGRCKVYTSNLKRVIPNSIYHKLDKIGIYTGSSWNGGISIEELLVKEATKPLIEMTVKANLYHLGTDFIRRTHNMPEMLPGNTLAKKLGIDNARMKRLKENDGGTVYLKWLKYEKKLNTILDDEDIQFMEICDMAPEDIKELLDLQSLKKIANYCKRQVIEREEKYDQIQSHYKHDVLSDWMDYISMMKKFKMDIHNEQLLKPVDLESAHNELVARMDMERMEEEIKEVQEKYPGVDEICTNLKRYEYANEQFTIIAPDGVKDIFFEGATLKHCIHTCEIYFNRIEQKESFLMFLRKVGTEGTPWYTLEIEPGGNIRQKKSVFNKAYADIEEAMPFLRKWQKWVQKTMNDKEKVLAKLSDKKRRDGYAELRKEKKLVRHGYRAGELLADVLEEDFLAAI